MHPPHPDPLPRWGRREKNAITLMLCFKKFQVQGSKFKVRGMLIRNFS
jgi:hypothetical protein